MKLCQKKRRGFTLLETVIALGIFGIIITIVISMFMTSLYSIQDEKESFSFQQGVDDFIYSVSREMKSAVEVNITGDSHNCTLEIIGEDSLVFYNVNNLKGEITRSQDEDYISVATGFESCTFFQEDQTSFTLIFVLSEDDMITQEFRCGSPTRVEIPEETEDSFESDPDVD